ncbi:DeoR/GlpR family DNA-binding transcription regulator [Tissierella sp.]|uniref:DeoR/GlpR family DNA-binding transcription regulator n=1 Tax=Tissierella sp. TaxID=41274 RepID=UPI0028B04D2A|nr:DeoR/GlpR family DNA-binding transcription regulator [Tissierella sp.]
MKKSERHQFILDFLKESPYVDVAYLTETLNVSEMTIRRDLSKLEEDKLLLRVHGGARRIPTNRFEAPLNSRLLNNHSEKKAIGRYAAGLVQDGDVIAMDASSTVYHMVEYLQDKKITVITNNISIAMGFAKSESVEVILLGGKLRKSSLYVFGYDTLNMMENYNTNKAFFSSTSLNIENGLTDSSVNEGKTKKSMVLSADESFLLMDTSKFGTRSYYNVIPLEKLSHIITNESNRKDIINYFNFFKEKNIQTHICV